MGARLITGRRLLYWWRWSARWSCRCHNDDDRSKWKPFIDPTPVTFAFRHPTEICIDIFSWPHSFCQNAFRAAFTLHSKCMIEHAVCFYLFTIRIIPPCFLFQRTRVDTARQRCPIHTHQLRDPCVRWLRHRRSIRPKFEIQRNTPIASGEATDAGLDGAGLL